MNPNHKYTKFEILLLARNMADSLITKYGSKAAAAAYARTRVQLHKDRTVRRNWLTIVKLIDITGVAR